MSKHTGTRRAERAHGHREIFAGDATGAVGGSATPSLPPDQLPLDALSPEAHKHNPGKPAHDIEDEGWVKEGQGSALAQEREGIPEREIPHHIPESAAQPRRKA